MTDHGSEDPPKRSVREMVGDALEGRKAERSKASRTEAEKQARTYLVVHKDSDNQRKPLLLTLEEFYEGNYPWSHSGSRTIQEIARKFGKDIGEKDIVQEAAEEADFLDLIK